ncbi:OsmC family protein [Natronosporangium hydrolyticum]|uniref:OsmC family protein n=1 Tax=Natronosporangium hydrolyticum TaxID=2811111 RepID=A0A895YE76_9ACTN|nr:OsmC family protein [Natronosporangium hydrolyticum]QSB14462.1 OsmC family protein [Natronosporangium hydrolyticum]
MIRNGIEVDQVTGFAEVLRTTPAAGDARLRTEHRWRGGYALDWRADQVTLADQPLTRRHTLRLDLPAELGGTDHGPAPGELIAAALGACVAHQFVEHAAGRGVVIDSLEVTCESQLDLRGAYQVAEVRPGWTVAKIQLSVRTEASDEVLAELLRDAVATSPVLDTVANPVPVEPAVRRLS